MRHLLLLCSAFILGYSQATAQFTDNFSDGNFTANPRWTGDSAVFKINSSHQLQLNTSGAGTAILSTGNLMLQDMEWSFWIKLSFSPSDNNLAWIYLSSDHADLKDSLNGYYLKFGENGSNDAIELVKQSGITHTVICRGTDNTFTTGTYF